MNEMDSTGDKTPARDGDSLDNQPLSKDDPTDREERISTPYVCEHCGREVEGVRSRGPAIHRADPCGCPVATTVREAAGVDRGRGIACDGGSRDRSFLFELTMEVSSWMAEDPTREDICDEVWGFALATFVDGQVITPMGYDVTDEFLPSTEVDGADRGRGVTADGGTTWADLTAFQRDVLEATARLKADPSTEVYGLAIKEDLEAHYGGINHGRLYPNLDELVERGLLEKGELDRRTNSYELTETAETMLEERLHRLSDTVGTAVATTDGGQGGERA